VDDLAHSNLPGRGYTSRWQDVAELMAAGIDVITTVSIGHLDSLADVAENITGVPAGRTVPDPVVLAAHEIELVDVTPEALRDRIARGQVYPREHAEAALSGAFRVGPLAALRELALLWLAASLTQNRQRYRPDGHVDDGRPTRERIMVGLTGGPEGQALIRRAARIAARSGGDLLAVHVARPGGPAGAAAIALAAQRQLTESIGGTYQQLADLDAEDYSAHPADIIRVTARGGPFGHPRHLTLGAIPPVADDTEGRPRLSAIPAQIRIALWAHGC
jgi:two-component system, OmpR family, sensor histidine kinase KdpD